MFRYPNLRTAFFDAHSGFKLIPLLRQLCENDRKSREEILAWRQTQETNLLRGLKTHPFFRDYSFKTLEDAPLTDKDTIREHFDQWFVGKGKKPPVLQTSGSTGKPFRFIEARDAGIAKRAARLRMMVRHGLPLYARELKLGGIYDHKLDFKERTRRVLRNRYSLSSLEMTDDYCGTIRDYLDRYQPALLVGYSTSLLYFAEWLKHHGRAKHHLRSVINMAEPILPEGIERLEEVFGCPVIDHYMASEGHLGHTCPHGKMHLDWDICSLRFVDGVCYYTNYYSSDFPLVNYCLGDRFELSEDPCECGLQYPLIKQFTGRTAEIFITKNGKKVSQGDINTIIAPMAMSFAQYRLKLNLTRCVVEYVKIREEISPEDKARLTNVIRNVFEVDKVEYTEVIGIPLDKSGKFRFFGELE